MIIRRRAARVTIAATGCALALATAPHAIADPDTDFANQLHSYGIYGPRDYNAWIGKITCKRMYEGVDLDANASAKFVYRQLDRASSTSQAWQFLGAAINFYCPEKLPVLEAVTKEDPK